MTDPKEPTGSPLAKKLAEIMGVIGWIPKRGWNDHQKYNFVREADVVDAVRGELSSRNIAVIPTVKSLTTSPIEAASGGKTGMFVMVEMRYELIDGDSGERMTIEGAGAGTDYPGDKAVFKAQTGAKKYALFQAFQIATGDDPEDETAEKTASSTGNRRSRSSAPKADAEKASAPSQGERSSQSPTGPASAKEKQHLIMLAQELGWSDDDRHAHAAVASFNDLTSARAQELGSVWQRYVNAARRAKAADKPLPVFTPPGAPKPVAEGSTPNPTAAAVHEAVTAGTFNCSNFSETGARCINRNPHEAGDGSCMFMTTIENGGRPAKEKTDA